MQRPHSPAPVKTLVSILAVGALLAGCGPKAPPAPTAAPAPSEAAAPEVQPPAAAPAADPAADAAAAQVEASLALTPEALEALLAPIALFPDPVLAQVLTSATNPQMVLDAGNWLIQNPSLKGRALDEAAQPLGFSPSMRALLQFPEVVDMMCMKLDWTTQLGEAFTADQAGVLDAVQRLRRQSVDVGNLASSDQLKVETETQEGKEVITVQPADPKVVYVPQYDPVAVYAPPPAVIPAPTTTTTVVQQPTGYSTGAMVTTGLLSFGAGLLVANVFDDDDDWDDYRPNYGYGGMYYGGRPYYPPPPGAYRPPYGGAYRPASGYNRPPGYQNGFNNNTIIVNNQGNDYWNKYGNKPTPYGGNKGRPNSPISTARPNRPELNTLDQQSRTRQAQGQTQAKARPATSDKSAGWQGQNSYKGAKPSTRPSTGRSTGPSTGKVQGGYAGATPQGKAARDQMVAGRPPASSMGQSKPAAKPSARPSGSVDRGYGQAGSSQARQTRQPDQNREASQNRQSSQNREAKEARQRDQARPSPKPKADRSSGRSPSGDTAFNRGGGGGNARADSQRGRQSMPQGARSKGGGGNKGGGGGKKSRR